MANSESGLINQDLAPVAAAKRTWRWWHFTALWLGMVIAVPAYEIPSSMLEQGMSAAQAVGIVLMGNLLVLAPILLIGHAGSRYGVPFAVLVRASFGVQGAKLPALARALVACGWYGIQTWIGGSTLLALSSVMVGHDLSGASLPILGIGPGQLLAFLVFWGFQIVFVAKGLDAISLFETWMAPLKILVCGALVWWALISSRRVAWKARPLLRRSSGLAAVAGLPCPTRMETLWNWCTACPRVRRFPSRSGTLTRQISVIGGETSPCARPQGPPM
jgi:NCS1 family nucleobase:cation symporter-1